MNGGEARNQALLRNVAKRCEKNSEIPYLRPAASSQFLSRSRDETDVSVNASGDIAGEGRKEAWKW